MNGDSQPMKPIDPRFAPIWKAIQGWEIERSSGAGRFRATGSDVLTLIAALDEWQESNRYRDTHIGEVVFFFDKWMWRCFSCMSEDGNFPSFEEAECGLLEHGRLNPKEDSDV